MNYKNIIVNLENGILMITINRPKQLNALNKVTLAEFEDTMKFAYRNDGVKGVIVTGSGEKAFIAGADIKEFADYTPKQGEEMVTNGQRILKMVEDCPKPVIAAVNGFALGGGCELAMSCHLRIASENAKFSQPEVNLGIIPGYGGTQRLIQLIGKGKALELMMTGDMIDAKEAKSLGLVNYVTSQDKLIPKALEILEKIKTKSLSAIKGIISCVNAYYTENVDGYKTEIKEIVKCFGTEDFKEGTNAFMEKRKPNFLS